MDESGTKRHLHTSEIARQVGVHPNTVRLYEEWGFLPPIPRSASGYRLYSQQHLAQMRLARTALHGGWPGRNIRQSALKLVRRAATGDVAGALEIALYHLALVQAERAQAETAADLLEHWAQGAEVDAAPQRLRISEAARRLAVTADMLRNWERNGLIRVPRNPENGYRLYGTAELERLRVVHMLNRAGYSQMAILRMLLHLDAASDQNLRQVLDTPRPDEDIHSAADRWLSSLAEFEARAVEIIRQLETMVREYGG